MQASAHVVTTVTHFLLGAVNSDHNVRGSSQRQRVESAVTDATHSCFQKGYKVDLDHCEVRILSTEAINYSMSFGSWGWGEVSSFDHALFCQLRDFHVSLWSL